MPRQFERFVINVGGRHRREKLEGRWHLVAPAVILTQDVIEGSKGPLFYPAEENGRRPSVWNHLPIVVNHPKKGQKFVSARTKKWLDSRKVGILLNTRHKTKLRTECWFDENRTKQIDRRLYQKVLNDEPVEVSTGLTANVELKSGKYKGKKYVGIVRDHEPDHLAVLPDSIGACSVKMGGGLFANASQEPEGTQKVLFRSAKRLLKSIGVSIENGAMSFGDTMRALSDLLAAEYGDKGRYWQGYVCEVFPDYCVFSDGSGRLFKQEYSSTEKNGVVLEGKAVPVVRKTTYREAAGSGSAITNEDADMPFDKKAHIDSLIANGVFESKERKTLLGMPDSVLEKIPVPAKKEEVANDSGDEDARRKRLKLKKKKPRPGDTPNPLKREDIMNLLSPEERSVLVQGQKALKASRSKYIDKIKADPKNVFKDEVLNEMDIDTLAGIANVARDPKDAGGEDDTPFKDGWAPDYTGTDFSAAPGGAVEVANEGGKELPVLKLPSMKDFSRNGTARRRKKRRA